MRFCRKCGAFLPEGTKFCPQDRAELIHLPVQNGDPSDPLIGQVLDGKYAVLARMGAGGMGVVYRAFQGSTRRDVALKVLRAEMVQEQAARFMLEAQTTSALRSLHTVTIFDFGETQDERLYLVMELLEGRTLDECLREEGALPWRRALGILKQVAQSLAEAHRQGVIHRDLKPENIFLVRTPEEPELVKVLDFGIAKLKTGGTTTNLTATGGMLGTPLYMSPEQVRDDPLDTYSDIYSLGVVLYHALAGAPPFQSENPVTVLMQHCQDPVPPLSAYNPGIIIPASVQSLLDAMLAKDPGDRIGTATLLREQAQAALDGQAHASSLAVGPDPASTSAAPTTRVRVRQPDVEVNPVTIPSPSASIAASSIDWATGELLEPATRRHMRPALVVAAIIVLIGGGLGYGFLHGRGTSENLPSLIDPIETASPAPVHQPETQPATPTLRPPPVPTLTIRTHPDQAIVFRSDGQQMGKTPLAFPSPTTTQQLRLELSGFRPADLSLEPGTRGEVVLELERIKRSARRPAKPGRPKKASPEAPSDKTDDIKGYHR